MQRRTVVIFVSEVILIALIITTFIYLYRIFDRATIEISIMIGLIYFLIFYAQFFLFYKYRQRRVKIKENLKEVSSLEDLKAIPLIISSSLNKITYAQPINVILITEKNIDKMMQDNGWRPCLTYSKHSIRLVTLLKNIIFNTPPMTDAYFMKNHQHYAFQKNAKLRKRDHIRIWRMGITKNGKTMYAAAISKDTNFSIKLHNNFYSPSHSIDPNVDEIRDEFAKEIIATQKNVKVRKIKLGEKVKRRKMKHYFTNGKVVILDF